MNTQKLTLKKTISFIVAMLFVVISSFADGDKTKSNVAEKLQMKQKYYKTVRISTRLMKDKSLLFPWMEVEQEAALEVLDLDKMQNMVPAWEVPATECELEVIELQNTNALIPYWMTVEEEPELEVTDLISK